MRPMAGVAPTLVNRRMHPPLREAPFFFGVTRVAQLRALKPQALLAAGAMGIMTTTAISSSHRGVHGTLIENPLQIVMTR